MAEAGLRLWCAAQAGRDLPPLIKPRTSSSLSWEIAALNVAIWNDHEETVDALKKLVKSAALERPTPLGEPSEGGGYREPPTNRGDVAKMAWEQFEETLLNYEGA